MSVHPAEQHGEGEQMWDPFLGSVEFTQHVVMRPGKGVKLPGFISNLAGLLILLGFLVLFVGVFYQDAFWVGGPMVVLGFALMFWSDRANKTDARIDWMLYQLAKHQNWAFELLPRARTDDVRMARAMSKDENANLVHLDAAEKRRRDPRIQRVHERVGDLLAVKIGRVSMLEMGAFFWGKSEAGIAFWMGLGTVQANMTFAAGPLKQDRYGNKGNRAVMIQMICAYRLDRDTGIRARLLHESVLGESKKDFQTEAVEFNRLFNISIADKNGVEPANAGAQHQALMQALTPATQATLISLKERYDVQVVIDHDVIFYAGWDQVNSDDLDVVEKHIHALTEAFAESAVSFKHYVE